MPKNEPDWRSLAITLLKGGLGVEDIAVQLSVSVSEVRFFVRKLRASGKIKDIYVGASQ